MRLFLNVLFATICLFLSLPASSTSGELPPEKAFIENVYLHTDRDLYVAGEYMHFKAYLLSDNNEPGLQSNFLYLALRNNDKVIKRGTIPVGKNYSSGSLYLPDTLSTGYYEIIAHTNWMRNYGEDSYFRKSVLIVNRFDQNPDLILNAVVDPGNLDVTFLPESGSFLNGVDNKLLLKTGGSFDSALRDVVIVRNNGDNDENFDTVVDFKLNVHGFATFSITPDAEYNYYASIEGADKLFELPEVIKTGSGLKVKEEKNKLLIDILATEESPNIDWLRINYNDKVVYEERVYDIPYTLNVCLDEEDIPNGLLKIETGGRGWGRVAQRLWYNYNNASEILIETDKAAYGKRDEISLTIDASELADDNAFLSMSVVKSESVDEQHINFDGYLRAQELAEALNYSQRKAVSLFGGMNIEQLNDYLIIDHFEDNGLNNNLENNFNREYFVEKEGIIVSGRVIDSESGIPLSNARVVLNKPDTIINILYSETDKEGVFHFTLSDYFHDKQLYFYVDPQTVENDPLIEVFDKFIYRTPFLARDFSLLRQRMDYIKRSQDIVRVNKAYSIDNVREVNTDPKARSYPPVLFSEANRTVYPGNFAPLDSLHEISREIVHSWQLRSRAGQISSRLICESTGKRLPEAPIYFLDGIIAYDVNKLTHLNSKKIQRIEIHNFQWYHGEMYFPGIIGFYTNNNDYLSTLADRTRTSMIKESLRKQTEYYTPEYNNAGSENSGLPDLRQVLYWNIGMDVEKGKSETITFYSGDLTGDYIIKIQGITSGGIPVNIAKKIKIN